MPDAAQAVSRLLLDSSRKGDALSGFDVNIRHFRHVIRDSLAFVSLILT